MLQLPEAPGELAVTAGEWWRRIRSGCYAVTDVMAFNELSRADQQRIRQRVSVGLRSENPKVRERAWQFAETIYISEPVMDAIKLPADLSRHIDLEIAAVFRRGGKPLSAGAPVPRCGCVRCTGIPARTAAPRQRTARAAFESTQEVAVARSLAVSDVAHRLGLEIKGHWATCPFHGDSHPSLHLNERKHRAFCNVCGKSWDGIALAMEYLNVTFTAAIRELTTRVRTAQNPVSTSRRRSVPAKQTS